MSYGYTCRRCDHFFPLVVKYWQDNNEQGHCALNPVWVPVKDSDAHFCSQFTEQTEACTSVNLRLERTGVRWRHDKDQQARAIRAEKKLKALRKKAREQGVKL